MTDILKENGYEDLEIEEAGKIKKIEMRELFGREYQRRLKSVL